ncbi:hypothetical protein EDD22DRAFT_853045 [Suillus occidentalis]|nr:hypothetical protein EDD22DRAFT_853045 [Suillus occidentalis]
MPPFNASMLTSTPTPEPEEHQAVEDMHMEDSVTDVDRLLQGWDSTLMALDGCVAAIPDLKEELLEDQKAWIREWDSVTTNIGVLSDCAKALSVTLEMPERDQGLLKEGHKSYKVIEAIIKGWKAKAIEVGVKAPTKHLVPSARASEVEVRFTDDDGAEPHMGDQEAPSKETHCNRCIKAGIPCGGSYDRRCPPCDISRKGCTFSNYGALEPKGGHGSTPCLCKVLPKHTAAKGSVKETASSIALDNDGDFTESNMDIEITGETFAGGKVLCGSLTIPPHAVDPIPSGSTSKGKGKYHNLEAELEEALVENACLKQQRADLLILSNKLFNMSQGWWIWRVAFLSTCRTLPVALLA